MHTLSDVVVQTALRYVPAGQAPEQGVHAVVPLVKEKLKPTKQGVHTLSDVVVQAVCCWPAGHAGEQGVHTVAPLMLEKLKPAKQGVHTLSDVVVQFFV